MTRPAGSVPTPDKARFIADSLANPLNREILDRLPDLGAADAWLVAGCLYQTVWNGLCGQAPDWGIKDYDVFYFDDRDLSYAAEDAVIKAGDALFADLPVTIEIRNQARVHLWYPDRFGAPYPRLTSARDGIARFLVACTCVGLSRRPDGGLALSAPYGLDDLYAGRLLPNDRAPSLHRYRAKAGSYQARWPWLTVLDAGGDR